MQTITNSLAPVKAIQKKPSAPSVQKTLFSKQVLRQAKVKKPAQPALPISLGTIVKFGIHKGKLVQQIVHKEEAIIWLAKKLKTTILPEVKTAISNYKLLSQ